MSAGINFVLTLLFIFIINILANENVVQDEGVDDKLRLRQVILFSRHGERTTVAELPSDVEDLFPEDPERNGILTPGGREQMRKLGKDIRSWLIEDEGLLKPLNCPGMKSMESNNSQYGQGSFEVRSTTYPRTIESAQYFLAGLFADDALGCVTDGDTSELNNLFDGLIEFEDYSFLPWDSCELLSLEWNSIKNSNLGGEIESHLSSNESNSDLNNELLRSIKEKMHLPYINSSNILQAFDPLSSYKSMYGSFPYGVTEEEFSELTNLLKKGNKDLLYGIDGDLDTIDILKHKKTCEYVRKLIAFGPINSVLDEFEGLIKGDKRKSFIYHSNHDLMLLAILSNLHETDGMLPPFASHVEFVVKEDKENELYLAVKYNGNDVPISAGDKKCQKEYELNGLKDKTSNHWCSLNSAIDDIRKEIPTWKSGFFDKACKYSYDDLRKIITESAYDL